MHNAYNANLQGAAAYAADIDGTTSAYALSTVILWTEHANKQCVCTSTAKAVDRPPPGRRREWGRLSISLCACACVNVCVCECAVRRSDGRSLRAPPLFFSPSQAGIWTQRGSIRDPTVSFPSVPPAHASRYVISAELGIVHLLSFLVCKRLNFCLHK